MTIQPFADGEWIELTDSRELAALTVQLARHIAAALNAKYRQGYEDGISGAKRAQLTGIEVEADETARRFIEDAREAYCTGYADGAADRREA